MDAVALLRWVIQFRQAEIGVFRAGHGIGKEPGDVWHCFGCKGEFCSDSGSVILGWDRSGRLPAPFPHEPDCKYVAACKICGIEPRN